MLKKFLCGAAPRKSSNVPQNQSKITDTSAQPEPRSAQEPEHAVVASPAPQLPQLELTTPVLASTIINAPINSNGDDENVPQQPRIQPTPRPPPPSDDTQAKHRVLPQLQRVSSPVSVTHSLTPPTPIDSPSSPVRAPTGTEPAFVQSPERLSEHHGSSISSMLKNGPNSKKRTSSHGSTNRTVKETLNAYAVENEDGSRMVNQYRLDGSGPLGKGAYATVERATDRETGIEYVSSQLTGQLSSIQPVERFD